MAIEETILIGLAGIALGLALLTRYKLNSIIYKHDKFWRNVKEEFEKNNVRA